MQQVFLDLYIAGIALFVVVSVHSKAMKQNKGETTCQTEEVATPLLNAWRKTSVILFLFFSERDTQLLFLDLLFFGTPLWRNFCHASNSHACVRIEYNQAVGITEECNDAHGSQTIHIITVHKLRANLLSTRYIYSVTWYRVLISSLFSRLRLVFRFFSPCHVAVTRVL